jgi:YD repeat-containing protein
MIRCSLFFVLVLLGYNAISQSNINMTNFKNEIKVFAPSPNAASLGKFGEIPVNTHTGIPNIQVPLYSWKSSRSKIVINVGLSYHAGGLKVEDIASNVGLGWSLSGSGVVTRTVRGLPDDHQYGYLNTPVLPDFNTNLYSGGYYENPTSSQTEQATMNVSRQNIIAHFNTVGDEELVPLKIKDGQLDTEQDVFFYSAGSASGQFVINKDGVIKKLDENNCKIEVFYTVVSSTYKYLSYFKITTDNGLVYLLDLVEGIANRTTVGSETFNYAALLGYNPNSPGIGSPPMNFMNSSVDYGVWMSNVSSFYASKIIDPLAHDTVYLEYTTQNVKYQNGFSESVEYYENDDPELQGAVQTHDKISSQSGTYTYNSSGMKSLSKILLSDGGSVEFIYELSRLDLQGSSALTKVIVSDYLGNKKRFGLNYDYFDSYVYNVPAWATTQTGPQEDYNPEPDHFNKRLKLVSIDQLNHAGTENYKYVQFQYNDTVLPPRNSKAIDFWGYFTGPERYSWTLVPQLYEIAHNPNGEGLQDLSFLWSQASYDGTDRTPDENYCKASILRKITYATGGTTTFDYEPNSVKDPIYFTSYQRNIKINSPINNISYPEPIGFNNRTRLGTNFYFKITRVNADGSDYVPPPYDPNAPQSCFQTPASSTITFSVKSTDNTVSKIATFNAIDQDYGMGWIYFDLPLGKEYYFYYTHNHNNDPCLQAYFKIETTVNYFNDNLSTLVGGVRIKSQVLSAEVNNKVETILYNYNDDDGFSTGAIPFVPNHSFHGHVIGKWDDCQGSLSHLPVFLGYARYKVRSSNSTQTLGYSFGSNVGYARVQKKNTSTAEGDLGKEVFTYSSPVIRDRWDVYPHKSIQFIEWASGHLLNQEVFDKNGTLQKKITNTYSDVITPDSDVKNRSFKFTIIRTDNCVGINPLPYIRSVAFTFYPYSGQSNLTQQKIEEFAGGTSMVRVLDYEYDYMNNIKAVKTTNSKNQQVATEYFYCYDFLSYPSIARLLTANNVSDQVFTRNVIINGLDKYQVSGDRIDYVTTAEDNVKPSKFYKFQSHRPELFTASNQNGMQNFFDALESEVLKYDQWGNPVEFQDKSGIKTAVIWGYNYTRPVLKIIGAGYDDAVAKFTSVTVAALQSVTDPAILRSKLSEVRQGYASNKLVQVLGFTYTPLFGTESETDANGRTTYYEYDGYGRLVLVRDKDQKIMKKICYGLSGQITTCGDTFSNPPACNGPDKRMVNGVCETGVKVCTGTARVDRFTWENTYYYHWSDGMNSQEYTEISSAPCFL